MSDVDKFLAEQQEHMDVPDEDFDEYLSRRGHTGSTQINMLSGANPGATVAPANSKQPLSLDHKELASRDIEMPSAETECGLGPVQRAKRKSPDTTSDVVVCATKKPKTHHPHEHLPRREGEANPRDRAAQSSNEHRVAGGTTSRSRATWARHMDPVAAPPLPPRNIQQSTPSLEGHARGEGRRTLISSDVCVPSSGSGQLPRPSSSGPDSGVVQEDTSTEKRIPNHATTNMGRGGKVLKSAKKSVALARITDSSTASTPSGNPVPSTSTAKTAVAQQSATSAKQKTVAPKRKTKAKPKEKERVTQTDYAQRLQTKFSEAYFAKKHPADLFLKGKTLFYYAPDHLYASEQTMRRMDIIVKAGGILLPTFDPERITHIVTEAGPFGLLGAIGLRSLREIPDHIHTVKWSWVVSGMGNGLRRPVASGKSYLKAGHTVGGGEDAAVQEEEKEAPRRMAYEVLHAAFASRLGAGPKPRASSKEAQNKPSNARGDRANSSQPTNLDGSESSSDFSGTSEFTQGRAFPGQSDPVTGGRHAGSCVPLPPPGTLHMGDARPNMSNAPYGASIMAEPTTRPCNAPDSALSLPTADDPLAEFYEQARAERDAELEKAWNGSHESDDGIDLAVSVVLASNLEALGKRTFACDNIGRKEPNRCPNQDVVDKLTELRDILKTKGLKDDHWRIISYNRGIGAIKAHPKRIKTLGEARAIRCVGERTAQKIMEILETGELQRIKYERTPDFTALKLFIQIYGAGPYTARKWFAAGCRTLEDVKSGKGGIKLSSVQKIGLEHYADINMRMPRSEASDIFSMIKPIALSIDPELFIEIMGSYRRGKADCGDIDILISRRTDDGKTHRGVFRRLLEELHRQGIITEDLCVPDDFDDLELIYRGLCRKQPGSPRRRIDFLTVPYQSTGAALLYYTGDDMFNRSMRLKANVMGYSLNQRGLYAGVIRDPDDRRQKLHGGHIVASETEQEIFAMLGVPWQEPHQRIRA